MNQTEANEPLKALRLEILRTHTILVKKQQNMAKAEKVILMPADRALISKEDIANNTKARKEAHKAHLRWLSAQAKYFNFIEENRIVSW